MKERHVCPIHLYNTNETGAAGDDDEELQLESN